MYVYDPIGRDEGLLRWQETHEETNQDVSITSLSWASPEELVLGGSRLRLWYIPDSESPKFIWDQSLPYPTALAYSSPDGELIASCGPHDRMVKIWRRLSYEVDSTRYDVSYLPHPTSITNLHWRKPWHTEQNLDNLLYTFCADSRLRVWVHLDHHSASVMQQVAEIDMCNIIQPRRLSVGSMSRRRYAFIIDSRDFSTATEKAVQTINANSSDHALEHLIAIANRSPEICIVLDGLGHMSVWGLENAGTKNKHATEVFNIAHIGDLNIHFSERPHRLADYTQFCIFSGGSTEASLSILAHSFDGSISWYDTQITHLFDTAPRDERVRLLTSWAGHDDPVKGIVRSQDGNLLCSWTDDGDVIVWRVKISDESVSLLQQQYFSLDTNIIDAEFLSDSLLLLREDCLQMLPSGTKVALQGSSPPKTVSRMSGLDQFGVFYDSSVEVYSTKTGKLVAKLPVPPDSDDAMLVPVVECSGSRDFMTVSPNGLATAFIPTHDYKLLIAAAYPTAVQNAAHVSAFGGKMALVDKEGILTIWDSALGVCEATLEDNLSDEIVATLDWHRTQQGNLFLAIACTFKIIILYQHRYNDNGSWSTLLELRVRDFTSHSIGRVCFLADACLVIGAGNQLFVPAIGIEANETSAKLVREIYHQNPQQRKKLPVLPITEIADALNSTLPIYHPRILHFLMDTSRLGLALKILISLHRHLKFFSEGDQLPSMLDFSVEGLINDSGLVSTLKDGAVEPVQLNGDLSSSPSAINQLGNVAGRLKENLESQRIPFLSVQNQESLADSTEIAVELEKLQPSVDEHALCYLHGLYSSGEAGVSWRYIMHASMSTSQEALVDLVTQHYGGKLTWEAARRSGIFMWLAEIESVRTQIENVGRAEYNKHEDRNPVDCSLYYLALEKKNVLQGLWRTSVGVREKANTLKLLANNFSDPKWKSTALKNAYALLSKRRFEYGAAFFLLGGSLKDAVNVCVHQIKDFQLAIAIARVYSDGATILKQVIEEQFLLAAARSLEGRWMACWAYHVMLKLPQKGVQALVRPLPDVLDVKMTKETLDFRINDPTMTEMYAQLRASTPTAIGPEEESRFVLQCAAYLRRMGCDFLALSLVRDWDFVQPSPEQKSIAPEEAIEDTEQGVPDEATHEAEVAKAKKKPPTQFAEPSADSLLDSFGF